MHRTPCARRHGRTSARSSRSLRTRPLEDRASALRRSRRNCRSRIDGTRSGLRHNHTPRRNGRSCRSRRHRSNRGCCCWSCRWSRHNGGRSRSLCRSRNRCRGSARRCGSRSRSYSRWSRNYRSRRRSRSYSRGSRRRCGNYRLRSYRSGLGCRGSRSRNNSGRPLCWSLRRCGSSRRPCDHRANRGPARNRRSWMNNVRLLAGLRYDAARSGRSRRSPSRSMDRSRGGGRSSRNHCRLRRCGYRHRAGGRRSHDDCGAHRRGGFDRGLGLLAFQNRLQRIARL